MTGPFDQPDWVTAVQVVDTPTLIDQLLVFTALPIATPIFDVSQFNSINASLNFVGPNANNVISAEFAWTEGGVLVETDTITMWGSPAANVPTFDNDVTLPARASALQLTVRSSGAGDTGLLSIVGSRRTVPAMRCQADLQQRLPALLAVTGQAIAAAGTATFRVGPTHGPIRYAATLAGNGNTAIFFAEMLNGGVLTESRLVSTVFNNNAVETAIYCPGAALRVTFTNVQAAVQNLTALMFAET